MHHGHDKHHRHDQRTENGDGGTVNDVSYAERSWVPLAITVELNDRSLRVGGSRTPLSHLNMVAMADAFLRGQWLGGGGAERPLDGLPTGSGVVPVVRASGSVKPVKARRAREFADALGQLALRRSGGADAVAVAAAQARGEGVPLWIDSPPPGARAHRPHHRDRGPPAGARKRLGRGHPVVRLRGPYGMP